MKKFISFFIIMFGVVFLINSTQAATYTVNVTDDSGVGSLRQAIIDANANAGVDTIAFDGTTFPTTTQTSITVTSQLTTITEGVIIDASANWDTVADRPGVRLTKSGGVNYGLYLSNDADSSRISGLKIDGFDRDGIYSLAETSQIGLDCLGTPNTNQRNVIVNNDSSDTYGGIYLYTADSNHIAGNWLGLDDDGTTVASNGYYQLKIERSESNIIGFEDSDNPGFSCTEAEARNIIAASDDLSTSMSVFMVGDVADLTQLNKISGNYINILPDGSAIVDYANYGIYMHNNTYYNFVGTDGDGNDDDKEGNTIAGFLYGGAYFQCNSDDTIRNRVSGNIFGGDPTGTMDIYDGSTEWGIFGQKYSEENIIGYCEDSDDAGWAQAMCSDSGSAVDQRNYFIGLTADSGDPGTGILLGHVSTADWMVYGNYFGVGTDGSSIPNDTGMDMRWGANHIIGGDGDKGNLFKNNEYGIWGYYKFYLSGVDQKLSNLTVQNNTITENTSHGIYFYLMDSNIDSSSDWATFTGNTITDNGGTGLYLQGTSGNIYDNTITGNTAYGIKVESASNLLLSGGISRSPYDDKMTHLDSAYDLVPEPVIGGSGNENTISGNSQGGIYIVDTLVTNDSTLYGDNIIGDNNSNFDIKSVWWGAVEILSKSLSAIKTGNYTVSLEPQSGSSYSGSAEDDGEFSTPGDDTDEGAWGPTGFDYDDAPTWFEVVNYEYDSSGTRTDYGPFTIKVTGDQANDALSPTFTFDGLDNDTCVGSLPCYYDTSGVYRYQIAEAIVSSIPEQPSLTVLTTDGRTNRQPSFTGSAFSDTAETHVSSTWSVYSTQDLCQVQGTGDIYDSGADTANLESITVPAGYLDHETTYYAAVKYTNSYGNYRISSCTEFSVGARPVLSENISNISLPAGTTRKAIFDLDDYFTGDNLTFSVHGVNKRKIRVIINSENEVTVKSFQMTKAKDYIRFKATSDIGMKRKSNQVRVKVKKATTAIIKGKKNRKGIFRIKNSKSKKICQVKAFNEGGVYPQLIKLKNKYYVAAIKQKTGTTMHIYNIDCGLIAKKRLSPKLHPRRMAIANLLGRDRTDEIVVSTKRNGTIYLKIFRYNRITGKWKKLRTKNYSGIPNNYVIEVDVEKQVLVKNAKGNILETWNVK